MKYVTALTYVMIGVCVVVVLADIAFGMHCGVMLRLVGGVVVVYGISRLVSPLTRRTAWAVLLIAFGFSSVLLGMFLIEWLLALGGQTTWIAIGLALSEFALWATTILIGGFAFGNIARARPGSIRRRIGVGITLLGGSSIIAHLAPYWRSYESPMFVAIAVIGLGLWTTAVLYGRRMIYD